MITSEYEAPYRQPIITSLIHKARSVVHFHAYDSPILNQWHQLLSAIREKANSRQWVTLINPPFIPNDRYMREIGLGDHYVRVIRLDNSDIATVSYIQRCLQNGKSAVVAVWANNPNELPDILLNGSPLGCQALVFTNSKQQPAAPQMELCF
ncbi:hypothetical protein [Reinekea sp. G2M2-21]|uniref:hypothetical protein n=1 Tax=Reinekea sp. G2M2-21 TaxID=2788942 RepID=UPI0018A8875B|nr:hypothetical protein [Reinekea sp. G2M2-21]